MLHNGSQFLMSLWGFSNYYQFLIYWQHQDYIRLHISTIRNIIITHFLSHYFWKKYSFLPTDFQILSVLAEMFLEWIMLWSTTIYRELLLDQQGHPRWSHVISVPFFTGLQIYFFVTIKRLYHAFQTAESMTP